MPLFGFRPRAALDALLTYPRFLGTIKPELMRTARTDLAARLGVMQASGWPKRLQPPIGRRLLALSPHPDDEAIGCGGLLLAHSGVAEIRIVNVYNGEGGGELPEGAWRDETDYKQRLVTAREKELDRAAQRLGATKVVRLGVSDCTGAPGSREIEALRREIVGFRPDVILLPWLLDNHPHHRLTNVLLADAAVDCDAVVLGYEIWSLLSANAYFDISEQIDKKLDLVSVYESQLRTVNYMAYARGLASIRAFHATIGSKRDGAAEAYFALPCRDYCDLVKQLGHS